jgi:hypothetical protein
MFVCHLLKHALQRDRLDFLLSCGLFLRYGRFFAGAAAFFGGAAFFAGAAAFFAGLVAIGRLFVIGFLRVGGHHSGRDRGKGNRSF